MLSNPSDLEFGESEEEWKHKLVADRRSKPAVG